MNGEPGIVAKLREAAVQQVGAADIEDFVGTLPLVRLSKTEEPGLALLQVLEREGDAPLPDAASAAVVAYWKVEDRERFTRIAGLWWDDDGRASFFQGRVWPPG